MQAVVLLILPYTSGDLGLVILSPYKVSHRVVRKSWYAPGTLPLEVG